MSVKRVLRDLNKLNTFVRVAERRNFTRAAEDLRTNPSVVSKHIKELEEALGFVVLNRSTHGVSLTEAGEGLLRNCLEMLDHVDTYVTGARNAQKLAHGTLRLQTIGEYASLISAPVVARCLSRIPGLRIHHFATVDVSQGVEDGTDIVLAMKRLAAPGFEEIDLGPVTHALCASPGYLAARGAATDPRMLKEHNCIADLKSPSKQWPFQVGGQNLMVEASGNLLSNGFDMARQAAILGLGVIRAPAAIVEDDIAANRLVPILDQFVASPERLHAYFSGGKTLPRKTAEFLSLLRGDAAAPD